jgi:hypothetical protein
MAPELYEHNIKLMSEQLLSQLFEHVEQHDIQSADAIYEEWIVDGKDPEEEDYVFLFIQNLNLAS